MMKSPTLDHTTRAVMGGRKGGKRAMARRGRRGRRKSHRR